MGDTVKLEELIRLKNSLLQTTEQMKAQGMGHGREMIDLLKILARLELQVTQMELDAGTIDEAAINAESAASVLKELVELITHPSGSKKVEEVKEQKSKPNTYWASNGRYQALSDKLNERVPTTGSIEGEGNRKLDRFRRASNAYYDIFNNGGANRAREIRAIFGVSMRKVRHGESIHSIVEPIMDKIIMAAAKEQGLA